MPARRLRSRALRRISLKLPGGRTEVRYEERKRGPARCRRCGRPLPGLPSRPRGLPRSSRKANRPFSDLCSRCSREALRSLLR
ncbi:MAG: hypothetical protein QXM46_00120 [Candidatus Hadarchaeales archaeon]